VLAFYHHGDFNLHVIVDERSASFFGLGIAKGSQIPVALVCTSGTATANYFPAIVEADKNNTPLVVVTADRPPKLRNTGTNQIIDQIELYGNRVRFFSDVLAPDMLEYSDKKIRDYSDYIRGTACKAISFATKDYQQGPVHINFPFTKPLEPTSPNLTTDLKNLIDKDPLLQGKKGNLPFAMSSIPKTDTEVSNIKELINLINNAERTIILCGPLKRNNKLSDQVVKLSNYLNLPIIADVLSGIRFSSKQNSKVITGINQLISSNIINNFQKPDLILHFGRNPISSAIEQYLDSLDSTPKVQITQATKWSDPIRKLDQKLQVDPIQCIDIILNNIPKSKQDQVWTMRLLELNDNVIHLINRNMENGLEVNMITQVIANIKEESNLFLSNSLPIRYVDEFVFSSKKSFYVYGNRGASGIDGIVSTAAGVAYSTKRPTFLIIGDLALFHDMQGILLLQDPNVKMSILVINNLGGGIFQRLPISEYKEVYNNLFNTPVDLDIQKISNTFEINYQLVSDPTEAGNTINRGIKVGINQILEYKTDSLSFENFRKKLHKQIKESLR
jgi:2-succinyl-5-enolpyruvyl-6-hydroxy-3-cyclohexene-1-carboxylate synthase